MSQNQIVVGHRYGIMKGMLKLPVKFLAESSFSVPLAYARAVTKPALFWLIENTSTARLLKYDPVSS